MIVTRYDPDEDFKYTIIYPQKRCSYLGYPLRMVLYGGGRENIVMHSEQEK
jgi:hypothetical protein